MPLMPTVRGPAAGYARPLVVYCQCFWSFGMSGIASFIMATWEHAKGRRIESRVFFVVGFLFLIVAFDQAWQDEHRNSQILQAEKSTQSSEAGFWKQQSYEKDASLRSRDELLSKNFSVLSDTQTSLATLSNHMLDITKPEPWKVITMPLNLNAVGGAA